MPISMAPTLQEYKDDLYSDQEYCRCNTCGCVQLKHLIDPSILYSNSHHQTSMTPTWSNHYKQFISFIKDNMITNTILDVGGSSGSLYNNLKDKGDITYTCLDICEKPESIKDINYIQANCETYDYSNNKEIVLSHVFEHLYEPRKFLQNISKTVDSVFISIPNMEHMVSIGFPIVLHNEHTYYIDKVYIEYLFSLYGFKLNTYMEYRTHSIFFHFIKINCEHMPLLYRPDISEKIISGLNTSIEKLKSVNIPSNSFISPAGYLGQFVYTICKPSSILGFLDNDPSKQNQRNYGTRGMVYAFDTLKEIHIDTNVYVFSHVFNIEIEKQIKSYENNAIHSILLS
jgi:2-polyprenyl-3-methyl-5-hydroxy-6-metoxy-1,4-benzoquinol methylase